jgi:hypothetical protein
MEGCSGLLLSAVRAKVVLRHLASRKIAVACRIFVPLGFTGFLSRLRMNLGRVKRAVLLIDFIFNRRFQKNVS